MPGVFDPLAPPAPGTPGVVTPEPLQTAADDLYRRMGPLLETDPENGFALMLYIAGVASPAEPLAHVSQETDTHLPWEQALDPDLAPVEWLDWLSQLAGVTLLPADTEQQARDRIRQRAGIYPGTDDAIKAEVARTLTSGDPAMVRLVHPAFWQITVATRTADTPDATASENAALRQIPAGFVLTYIVSDEPIIDEGTRTIDAAAAVNIDAPPTVADVT